MSTNGKFRNKNGTASIPPKDEATPHQVQEGVQQKNLVPATVKYLDETAHIFYIAHNADGTILFDMVCNDLRLRERDYFGLAFYDDQGLQRWLYKNKKISKQLKGLPWEFCFEVKFYPLKPDQLMDEYSRHLLYLQLRKDVLNTILPASFAAQAELGGLVAQAEYGDFDPNLSKQDYVNNLIQVKVAQAVPDQQNFVQHVQEFHQQKRGNTKEEAEFEYLNSCKDLAFYGLRLFPAKDNKRKQVHIGVNAKEINIYCDQMRTDHFPWADTVRVSYKRSNFEVQLKPGILTDQKSKTIRYKSESQLIAKLAWKCVVEYHGFYRLVQPDKLRRSFFRKKRFQFQGRTITQAQMASQLFTSSSVIPKIASKSAEPILQHDQTSPVRFVDQGTPLAASTAKKTESFPKRSPMANETVHGSTNGAPGPSSPQSSADYIIDHDGENTKFSGHEYSPPHTTVHTFHERTSGPETITTETDQDGNIITRIVKTETEKQTIQTQSYQTYSVDENLTKPSSQDLKTQRLHTSVFENNVNNHDSHESGHGQVVTTKKVTSGNRTIETITTKKEENGNIETHIEHRITIHDGEELNHEKALSQAIIEVTNLDPSMNVEKIESFLEESSQLK